MLGIRPGEQERLVKEVKKEYFIRGGGASNEIS
jgi:hypothetical protein